MYGVVNSKMLSKVMGKSYQFLDVHLAKHGGYAASIKIIYYSQ